MVESLLSGAGAAGAAEGAEGTGAQASDSGKAGAEGAGKAADAGAANTGKEGQATAGAEGAGGKGAEGDGKSGGEGKAGDGKANEKAGEGADALVGAPEAYADFTIPEGLVADEKSLGEFKDFAKSLNASQKGAQMLIDKFSERIEQFKVGQQEAWANVQKEWRKASEADKDIGGQKLNDTVANAKTALNEFGNSELVELFEGFGLNNHKAVLSFLAKVGAAVSEDKTTGNPGKGSAPAKSLAERLYPTHSQK